MAAGSRFCSSDGVQLTSSFCKLLTVLLLDSNCGYPRHSIHLLQISSGENSATLADKSKTPMSCEEFRAWNDRPRVLARYTIIVIVQRERKSFCSALRHGELSSQTSNRARTTCNDTTAPQPGRSSGWAAYHQRVLQSGAFNYNRHDPCHGLTRSLCRTEAPSGSPGHGGLGQREPARVDDFYSTPTNPVYYTPTNYHGTFMAPKVTALIEWRTVPKTVPERT